MTDMIGTEVLVQTTLGIDYTGILVEIGETEVYLRAENGWMVIPMDNVTSIKPKQG